MTVVVYIGGLLLALLGLVFIWLGVPIVRMEIGWSEVIGGSVAASAGCVILAIGVVLQRLEDLRGAILSLNVTTAWRDTFTAAEPEPAWEEPVSPPFAPHPLAPLHPAATAAQSPPTGGLVEEPMVAPEPSLPAAPLHAEAPEPRPDAELTPEITESAPALLPHEDQAPPLPPVEPVPLDTLSDPEEAPPAPAPARAGSLESARSRPNFLAAFLARRSAATLATGQARANAGVESALIPLREVEEGEPPVPTTVDLSSGWDDPPPSAHMPSGLADDAEAAPPAPAPTEAETPAEWVDDIPAAPTAPVPDPEHLPEPVGRLAPAAPEEPEETEPMQPVVVGRYNAGSASYVMYSTGMIEVETEGGTHQFASMQELKSFIERRDAAKV